MTEIYDPRTMNERFAAAFNARDIDALVAFYDADAAHFNGQSGLLDHGSAAIRSALLDLIAIDGTMVSNNRVCLVQGDLALLRADWKIQSEDGEILFSGSSMEVARRQRKGNWLTVIDHAVGASDQ